MLEITEHLSLEQVGEQRTRLGVGGRQERLSVEPRFIPDLDDVGASVGVVERRREARMIGVLKQVQGRRREEGEGRR